VLELRQQYPLDRVLKKIGLPRSTFFYQKAALVAVDKYASVKAAIKALYIANDGIYGLSDDDPCSSQLGGGSQP
jgi:hypothetical protein